MKKTLLRVFILLCSSSLFAQNPYTQPLFQYDSILNLNYGTAIDYSGNPSSLLLDIYKPKGDNNCKRPLILLLHGGAWVVGNKEDASMKLMAREYAKRGWVVANLNYRLGTHKNSDYNKLLLCSANLSEPCAYICDSAEAIRANYRAMQDAKGAVRYMKNRNLIDSTDINNVFMAGESAGAFVSLMVAFLDQASEKPTLCSAIPNAPTPDSYFNTSTACISNSTNLSRPDLGDIYGDLNLGSNDATIRGVGIFFGATFDLNIFTQNINSPCIYMFAQGSDVIVNYKYGKLFGRIDSECYNNFLCQNYEKYPYCYGAEGLRQYFVSNPTLSIDYSAEIINNYNFNNNCITSGHVIDNPQLRIQNMADYFSSKIVLSGNTPSVNCNLSTSTISTNNIFNSVFISNNLTDDDFVIHTDNSLVTECNYYIINGLGEVLKHGDINSSKTTINVSHLNSGLYYVKIKNKNITKTFKVIKL